MDFKYLIDNKVPVLPNTPNVRWDEMLQNNQMVEGYEDKNFNEVIDVEVIYYICVFACMMQEFRDWHGSVDTDSGYRPELYNDVVLIENGYKSTKTSDHKFNKSGAWDCHISVSNANINKWKEICTKYGVSYSIGKYSWGLHLGFRVEEEPRLWDWR